VVDAGAVSAAAEEIADIGAVDAVHVVTGEHDIIARLSLEDRGDLPNVVADHVHTVTGVADTVTNVAFEP